MLKSTAAFRESYEGGLRTIHLFFRFVMPQRLISARGHLADAFLGLSPTADLGLAYTSPYTGIRYAQPNITYALSVRRLRASVPSGSMVHYVDTSSSLVREVSVCPANDPPPPTDMNADWSTEYCPHLAVDLRRRYSLGLSGALTVSAAEPAPMTCRLPSLSCGSVHGKVHWLEKALRPSTVAYLDLVFTPCVPHVADHPPTWALAVTQAVHSRTFFSTHPMEGVPTNQTVKQHRAYMQCKERKYPPSTQIYFGGGGGGGGGGGENALRWIWVAANDGDHAPGPYGWKATLPTCIIIPQSCSLLPSFLNQLSARRYNLVLHIQVIGMWHRTIKLVLPLQLVYASVNNPPTN